MKTTVPVGNHCKKLCITTEAISVLPIPVGSETSVFSKSAAWLILCWYAR